MFRRMTERINRIQSIGTNTLEQLNIDFSGGNKPDIVIKNEKKSISSISLWFLL